MLGGEIRGGKGGKGGGRGGKGRGDRGGREREGMCLVVAIQGGRKLETQNLMSTFRLNSIIPARNVCCCFFYLLRSFTSIKLRTSDF